MDNTPVILIGYSRAWHTEQVLNSLRQHNIQNLFIFSDGPKDNDDLADVYETRLLFQKIDWTKPTIFEREKNIGLANSIVSAVNYVFKQYDRIILLEDDCVPQKYFFDFVGNCLNRYENNEEVFGISGYTVPIPESILNSYPHDLYFYPRIGSWGWATWKRAWQHFEPDLAKSYDQALAKGIDLSQGGTDIPVMLNDMKRGNLKDIWTLHWLLSVYLQNGCYIYPTVSHIENIGMDGSGVHCHQTQRYQTPVAATKPSRYPENIEINRDIYRNFRRHYDIQQSIGVKPAKSKSQTSQKMPLKVVHLCMQDFGGAGRAAYRLHKGLQAIGINSTMLVLNKATGDPSVRVLPNDYSGSIQNTLDVQAYNSPVWNRQTQRWQRLMLKYPNRPAGLEMFTDAVSDVRLDHVHEIQNADIINLHWVSGAIDWLSVYPGIGKKPIIWTLHDMNPFTGGCHYAGDCTRYMEACGACPQLGSETHDDLSNLVWKQKFKAYGNLNIYVVTPSHWLGKCSSQSKLFSSFIHQTIPNGFPIDVFRPHPRKELKRALNISDSAKVILFGADSVLNKRKGFKYLIEALNQIPLKSNQEVLILTFGSLPNEIKIPSKYSVLNLGSISDEGKLAMAYSLADVFVVPSLEDNLPNTVIEAMACGVPVVGFNIGGMPDMIDHKKNGYLVKPKDKKGLIEGIDWVISSVEKGLDLRKECRLKVEKEFALNVQAEAYVSLYSKVATRIPRKRNETNDSGKNELLNVGNGKKTNIIGTHKTDFGYQRSGFGDGQKIASPEDLYQTVQGLLEQGSQKETIGALIILLEVYPDYALAHNDLAVMYFKEGDKKKALRHYQKAVQLSPENITFLKNLADFYYVEAGELEKALKIYLKVLVVNPTDIETLLILGTICVSLEKNADARIFYNRVLEVDPLNLDVREKLAALSRGSGTDGGLQTPGAGEQMPTISRREEQQNMDRGLLPDGADTEKYLVSAIVSTYNAERFIRGRMENLVNQTLFKKNQLEIIVIDSNSDQNERKIVEAFMGDDNHIIYERTSKRETVYGAWNRGIKAAKGTYVINANTDDRFAADALERMADELSANPHISAVYGDWLMTKVENDTFDSHTKKQVYHYPEFFPPLFFYGQITTHAALLRKSIFEEIGFYDEGYKVTGDREFMFRFSAHGLKAKKIPHIVGLYLENQSGIEHSETNSGITEYASISEQFISPEYFVRLLGYDSVPDNTTLAQLYADIGSMGKGLITTNGTPIVNIVPAEKLLDKALAFDDKNIMALNNSGVVACFKGEKENAIQMFECALNVPCQENLRPVIEKNLGLVNRGDAVPDDYAWMKPVSLDYHIWVRDQDSIRERVLEGERLLQEKQYGEAKKIFLEVLKEDPCDAIAHNDLGVLFFQEGNKEKSLYHYEQAAELQPENITFQKNLADFHYLVMGRVNEALRIYTKVLAANPKDIESLLIMGQICVSLHKVDDAEIFFKRMLEIEPGNKDARQYLDKILGDQGAESSDSKEQQGIERDALLNGPDAGKILISAIVSTYNAERFIRGCLEDLEAQTIAHKLEIIVVDSGSQQNEKIIVKEFQKKYTNIKYIRTEQRETVYAAWNRGIRAAAGKYITNANSDDRHRKNALEKMVDVLEQRPDIALVYANVIKTENENETLDDFTPSGTYCWKDFDPKTLADGCYIGPQPMWRKDVHKEYGYFDETFHSAGDWEFWLRISQNETFLHLNEFLGLYLESPTSVGHRDPELLEKELTRIRWQYGPLKPQSTKVAEKMYQEAQSLVNGGMKKEAMAALLELLNAYPDFAMAHNDLGVLYSNESDQDNALKQYQRAVELEPENPIFAKNLADFYYVKLGRTEEALALYVKLLASNPMDVEILTALGHICIGLEKYDHAEIFVSRILEADPWNQNAKKILDGLAKRQAMGSVDQEIEAIGRKEAGSRVSLAEKIY